MAPFVFDFIPFPISCLIPYILCEKVDLPVDINPKFFIIAKLEECAKLCMNDNICSYSILTSLSSCFVSISNEEYINILKIKFYAKYHLSIFIKFYVIFESMVISQFKILIQF